MWQLKLKGGALYISLIICIIIGITLSVFILIANFNQRAVLSQLLLTQLKFNLNSGINMARSADFLYSQYNNHWQQLNDDSIKIKKLQWGAFELIHIKTKNNRYGIEECGIYGIQASKDTALVIKEKNRALSASGKLKLNGNCYISTAGIKPAFIDGQSFDGDSRFTFFLRPAPFEVPQVKGALISSLKKCVSGFDGSTDSLVAELPFNARHSFSSKTIFVQQQAFTLSNCNLSGNIKLIGTCINIQNTCTLNNVLLVANKVIIQKGFKGMLHIIAKDSIILKEDCILEYPSSLTVLNQNTNSSVMKGVFIDKNCIVNGAILTLNDPQLATQSKVIVKLNKNCEVYGLIYSSCYAHIQGKVFGTVYCETPMVVTGVSNYENNIIDCELNSGLYANSLVMPAIFNNTAPYKCCKKL